MTSRNLAIFVVSLLLPNCFYEAQAFDFEAFKRDGGNAIPWDARQMISSVDFPCPKEGFYPHPKNCTRFYRCVDFTKEGYIYSRYLFECPAENVFAKPIEACVPGTSCPSSGAEQEAGTDSSDHGPSSGPQKEPPGGSESESHTGEGSESKPSAGSEMGSTGNDGQPQEGGESSGGQDQSKEGSGSKEGESGSSGSSEGNGTGSVDESQSGDGSEGESSDCDPSQSGSDSGVIGEGGSPGNDGGFQPVGDGSSHQGGDSGHAQGSDGTQPVGDGSSQIGSDSGPSPGSDGGSQSGGDSGSSSGNDGGQSQGSDSGSQPAGDGSQSQGSDSGSQPAGDGGQSQGSDSGSQPAGDGGQSQGSDSGSQPAGDGGQSQGSDSGSQPGGDGGQSQGSEDGSQVGSDGGQSPGSDGAPSSGDSGQPAAGSGGDNGSSGSDTGSASGSQSGNEGSSIGNGIGSSVECSEDKPFKQTAKYCNVFYRCGVETELFTCNQGTTFSDGKQMCRLSSYDEDLCVGKGVFEISTAGFRKGFAWEDVAVFPIPFPPVLNALPFSFKNQEPTDLMDPLLDSKLTVVDEGQSKGSSNDLNQSPGVSVSHKSPIKPKPSQVVIDELEGEEDIEMSPEEIDSHDIFSDMSEDEDLSSILFNGEPEMISTIPLSLPIPYSFNPQGIISPYTGLLDLHRQVLPYPFLQTGNILSHKNQELQKQFQRKLHGHILPGTSLAQYPLMNTNRNYHTYNPFGGLLQNGNSLQPGFSVFGQPNPLRNSFAGGLNYQSLAPNPYRVSSPYLSPNSYQGFVPLGQNNRYLPGSSLGLPNYGNGALASSLGTVVPPFSQTYSLYFPNNSELLNRIMNSYLAFSLLEQEQNLANKDRTASSDGNEVLDDETLMNLVSDTAAISSPFANAFGLGSFDNDYDEVDESSSSADKSKVKSEGDPNAMRHKDLRDSIIVQLSDKELDELKKSYIVVANSPFVYKRK